MRRRLRSLPLLLAALPACGGDAPPAGAVSVDTVAGVERVRVAGDLPAWRLEPAGSIGSADEGGPATPQSFGRISSILADGEGNVYVAEVQSHQVRVFAPDGRHLRTLGREGAGPGEFRTVQSLAWLGDTLAVLDTRNARISLEGRDGTHLGTWAHQPLSGSPVDVRLFRAGPAEAYVRTFLRGGDGTETALVRLTPAGPRDTVTVPSGRAGPETVVVCQIPGGMSFFAPPFAARRVFEPGPDGRIAVSGDDTYRIVLVGRAGDTVRVVSREQAPVPVRDAEWDSATAGFRAFRDNRPGASCKPRDLARPAAKQPVQQILFSPEGEMWVEAVTPRGTTWEVFDGDGRPLGAFPAPRRVAGVVPYVRDDRLYVVRNDSLDVPFVDVFRVVRGGR